MLSHALEEVNQRATVCGTSANIKMTVTSQALSRVRVGAAVAEYAWNR
jgi:hypothetical protein